MTRPFYSFVFGTTAEKPKQKGNTTYLPPLLSLRCSSLSKGFYGTRIFRRVPSVCVPAFPKGRNYDCTDWTLRWIHDSLRSYPLPIIPFILKKMTRLIVGYCRDASAVPGFQIVETAQRDVSTRNIRGWGSGREGKGTSSLPLILLFVLCSLTSRCTLLPQCLEQARYSEGYVGSQFNYPPKHLRREFYK